MLQRAVWALDEAELETLKERAEYFGLDKTTEFCDYKEKYLQVSDTVNTIYTSYVQRNNAAGKPSAITHLDVPLNNRQQKLLNKLAGNGSVVTVVKSAASMKDLAALTAKTGVEYAMFTKGNERLVVRGDAVSVNINEENAREMRNAGYRWSGHTHPGTDSICLTASDGDYAILRAFGQEQSVIYNSNGQHMLFYL